MRLRLRAWVLVQVVLGLLDLAHASALQCGLAQAGAGADDGGGEDGDADAAYG